MNPHETAIYVRISKEDAKAEGGSIETQVFRCKQRLASMGLTEKEIEVIEVYSDDGYSGKSTNRPEFLRLQKDIRKGKVRVLLFSELSRISRNLKDFLEISETWRTHEVQWVSLREAFDTTTMHGKLILNILMSLYQFEREQTAYRTKTNMTSRAEQGLWNGGVTPYGYETSKTARGGLAIVDDEAKGVREIFDLYLELGSCLEVSKVMNSRGFRNKKGKPLNTCMVEHSLHNAVYVGLKPVNLSNRHLSPEEKEKLPADQHYRLVPAQWMPIVDQATFDRVAERFEAGRGRNLTQKNRVHDFVLTGIATCADCGQLLEGSTAHSSKYLYYRHPSGTLKETCARGAWSAVVVEEGVFKRLERYVEKPEIFGKVVDNANAAILDELPSKRSQLEDATKKAARLEGEISTLGERLATLPTNMDPSFIYASVTKKQTELEEVRSNVRRLEAEVRDIEGRRLTPSGFIDVFGKLLVAYEHLNPFEKKQALAAVFDAVELGFDTLKLVLADEPPEVQGIQAPETQMPGPFQDRAICSTLRLLDSNQRPSG